MRAATLLVTGALPFAALTFSTVVTPHTAVLMLIIGLLVILGPGPKSRGMAGTGH